MFIMQSFMTMNALHQQQLHQQMDMDLLYRKNAPRPNQQTYEGTGYASNREAYHPDVYEQPLYYQESLFTEGKEHSPFDEIEIIDMMTDRNLCYLSVDILNEDTVAIKCEVKKGYMQEEELEELIHEQILIALQHGYPKILAIVGKNDEMAEEILKKMGFAVN